VDPEPQVSAATTVLEDVQLAYRLIKEHYACLKYPPENAGDYISALATSLECQVSESVQLIISAFAFHIRRGCYSRFVYVQMIGRAEAGLSLRQVVMFAYPRRRNYDPPVSNTGVTVSPTGKGES
jgi:hypothetical protein